MYLFPYINLNKYCLSLNNRMENYSVIGSYEFSGQTCHLLGNLNLSPDGTFKGSLTDNRSSFPEQAFVGTLSELGDVTRLAFIKYAPHESQANTLFVLEKPKEEDFQGRYAGEWFALPYKIDIREKEAEDINPYEIIKAIKTDRCRLHDEAYLYLRNE